MAHYNAENAPVSLKSKRVDASIKERKRFCPICGNLISPGESIIAIKGSNQHRCDQRRLDAIDRAMRNEGGCQRSPTYSERLELAEVMIGMVED